MEQCMKVDTWGGKSSAIQPGYAQRAINIITTANMHESITGELLLNELCKRSRTLACILTTIGELLCGKVVPTLLYV